MKHVRALVGMGLVVFAVLAAEEATATHAVRLPCTLRLTCAVGWPKGLAQARCQNGFDHPRILEFCGPFADGVYVFRRSVPCACALKGCCPMEEIGRAAVGRRRVIRLNRETVALRCRPAGNRPCLADADCGDLLDNPCGHCVRRTCRYEGGCLLGLPPGP
jgi:hypothetical protein